MMGTAVCLGLVRTQELTVAYRESMRITCSILAVSVAVLSARAQTRPAIATPIAPPVASSASSASAAPIVASADPGTPGASTDSYIIGPGDTLQFTVWKEPTLSNGGVPVRPDGRISLPLLGDVPASGLTPMALSLDIAERLKKYINDPLVTVTMVSVIPKEIFLIGEIQKTGPIVLSAGMTPLQAIAAAGGISPYAKKKLYILRKGAKGEQKIPFDYKKALKTGDSQGITLMAGDTIVVP